MMNRSKRKVVAQETVQILETQHYRTPGGERVDLSENLSRMLARTELLAADDLDIVPDLRFAHQCEIEVSNESIFEALDRLSDEFPRIGCLNFASAKNPGGGFLNGSQAQEEAITRSSTLYSSLLSQREYYDSNRAHSSSLYLDQLILSPDVAFFRNDQGELLSQPFSVTVVTAPAPNAGAVKNNEPNNVSKIADTYGNRAELVLRALAKDQVDAIVLGAWGCGVFQNDPNMVSEIFSELLSTDQYGRHFEKVTFAVYDPKKVTENYLAFVSKFEQ